MRQLPWILFALTCTWMSGCGDSEPSSGSEDVDAQPSSPDASPSQDSGPGDGAASPDAAGSSATSGLAIDFPPTHSRTDASAITVRGRAASAERIASIRIAGIEATTTDSYATWQATIPLAPGHNTLTVAVETASGSMEAELPALRVTRSTPVMLPIHPARTAIDLAGARALTISDTGEAVGTMTLADGIAELAVAQSTGPEFSGVQATLYDATSNRLFLLNKERFELHSDLFAVDLATGERTLLSDGSTNLITQVRGPATSLIHDELGGRILALDSSRRSVVAIDLATGSRSIVTSPTLGSGPTLGRPRSMALDAAQGRVLLGDCYFFSLYAADLATGDRTMLASPDTGEGVGLGCPLSIAMDPDGQHAWLVSKNAKEDAVLLKVELATGNRTEVARSASTPSGTDVGTGVGFAVDAKVSVETATGRLLLISRGSLIRVDPQTGNRAYVWDPGNLGMLLGSPTAGALDPMHHRAIIADQAHRQLVAVDLASGFHQPLFDARESLPGAPLALSALAMDPAAERGYLVWTEETEGALLNHVAAIDMATGMTSTLASLAGDLRAGAAVDSAGERMFLVHTQEFAEPSVCREFTVTAMAEPGRAPVPLARIHPCTGGGATIPELATVDAITFHPGSGELLLVGSDEAGAVLLVALDPTTSIYQILDGNAFTEVDASRVRWATDVHAASSTIFVAGGSVLRQYDPTAQRWTTVSGSGIGAGPQLTDPRSLAIDDDTGIAVVADAAHRAALIIDLVTQERVLVLP